MPHLAFVIPSATGGGVEKVVVLLANEFASRGIPTDLVIGRTEGPNMDFIDPAVNVVDLQAPRMRNGVMALRKYASNAQPNVIVSGMHHSILVTELALTGLRRKPVHIGTVHNMWRKNGQMTADNLSLPQRLVHAFENYLFTRTTHLLAVSEGVREQYARLYNLPAKKTSAIYNPINISAIEHLATEPLAHKWMPSAQPLVLATGRLTHQKAFDVLLHAFTHVHKETNARLIILGDGELRPELEALRTNLQLDNVVDMPGYIKNPYAYMASSDLFVLSSHHEGLGVVLLEALAVGTPIVSTDCPSGPAEIIGNNEWGLLAPVDDPVALSEAIVSSLRTQHDTKALKQRAAMFDVAAVADRYLALIRKFVN